LNLHVTGELIPPMTLIPLPGQTRLTLAGPRSRLASGLPSSMAGNFHRPRFRPRLQKPGGGQSQLSGREREPWESRGGQRGSEQRSQQPRGQRSYGGRPSSPQQQAQPQKDEQQEQEQRGPQFIPAQEEPRSSQDEEQRQREPALPTEKSLQPVQSATPTSDLASESTAELQSLYPATSEAQQALLADQLLRQSEPNREDQDEGNSDREQETA